MLYSAASFQREKIHNIYEDEALGALCNNKRTPMDYWVGWGDIKEEVWKYRQNL